MAIQFKSKLSSIVANATWLDKTIDDATVGKFSLREDSSAHIEDIQLFLNTLRSDVNSNDVELSDHEIRISDNETLLVDHETRIGDNETNISTNTSGILDINNSLGQPNGIATLEGDGKVPASQLPSYVDDVEEYADLASFPVTGETGKIYVAIDTGKTYRWSGSIYVEISASDVNSVNGQTGVVVLDKSDIGLTNVTDDAQLKREAGDLNTFTEKVTPVIDDIVIIEDSEDSFNKKKVKLANMLGSGGDAGINYISNSQFESDISDWTGDTNLIISHETVNPLRGDGSLKINKGAIDASTQKVSSLLFTIDDADLAKVLTISFDKDFSDANYNDGDVKITIIQDPSGTPSVVGMNGNDVQGGTSVHYARFQSDSTIKDYRLDIEWVSTSADAVEALIDNVTVAPQVINQGAIVTDWEEYTPIITSFDIPSNVEFEYRRSGDSLELRGTFLAGTTPTAVEAQIGLPPGLSIGGKTLGVLDVTSMSANYDSVAQFKLLATRGDTYLNVGVQDSVNSGLTPKNGNSILGSGEGFGFTTHSIPIQGWSSQVNMSSDFGGREISLEAAGNAGENITADFTDVPFIGLKDTTSSWNGTEYTPVESGTHSISGMVLVTTNLAGQLISLYRDGVLYKIIADVDASGNNRTPFSLEVELERKRVYSIKLGGNVTLINNPDSHYLNINKLATPQTNLESETVAARYTSDSGQLIAGGVQTTLLYEDLDDHDTHNAYNPLTGIYKVPKAGFYDVNASAGDTSISLGYLQTAQTLIVVNGVTKITGLEAGKNTTTLMFPDASGQIFLKRGDELRVDWFSQAAATMATGSMVFSVARIK